jgi:hypothetical protein
MHSVAMEHVATNQFTNGAESAVTIVLKSLEKPNKQ